MVRPISDLDVPVADVEKQCEEIKERARQNCGCVTPAHLVQWHDFLDIDPDLLGRDYGGTL